MYKYLASAWVAAPAEEVFGFYCTPANWQPALPSLLAVEILSEPPFTAGTRWRQRRRLLWTAQESEAEVVGFEPPHTLECRIHMPKLAEAGGTLEVAHYMKEEGAGTRWIVGASLAMPQAMPRLVEWTVYAPMRWSARRDLASFKKAIERGRKG
jgi:hypothetical protein